MQSKKVDLRHSEEEDLMVKMKKYEEISQLSMLRMGIFNLRDRYMTYPK